MPTSDLSIPHFWHLLTRLGEAQVLLPAALLALLALVHDPEARPLAFRWMALTAVATLVTTMSKLAFIGWGIGWSDLDFTGVSGHAMFASAVYPVVLGTLTPAVSRASWRFAVFTGFLLALLVGVSRVLVGAHSISEVVAGLLLGGLVSGVTLRMARFPHPIVGKGVSVAVALWLALMPGHAPASQTHAAVTRLSLMLSGHKMAYTRSDMLRKQQGRRDEARRAQAPHG